MPPKVFTTYQAARLCNAHHTTVINWVNQGKLKAYSTPGGHRRIREADLLSFMSEFRIPVIEESHAGAKKRVLVVDDDLEMLEEYKIALAGHGFDLDFASDGFEVGRKIYSGKPDLILLDFKMPGMDGFEVCKFLHQDRDFSKIPIFAVTVLTSAEDILKIKAYGVQEYIPKPVDIEKLLVLIAKTLNLQVVETAP